MLVAPRKESAVPNDTTTSTRIGAWPTFMFRDADAALEYLVSVIGFRESAVYRGDDGTIAHAELLWPDGGGIMFGADKGQDGWPGSAGAPGTSTTYLVTTDVDSVASRVEGAGWRVLRPVHATDYGSTEFAFLDPEGNAWSVGTYAGAHAAVDATSSR